MGEWQAYFMRADWKSSPSLAKQKAVKATVDLNE